MQDILKKEKKRIIEVKVDVLEKYDDKWVDFLSIKNQVSRRKTQDINLISIYQNKYEQVAFHQCE